MDWNYSCILTNIRDQVMVPNIGPFLLKSHNIYMFLVIFVIIFIKITITIYIWSIIVIIGTISGGGCGGCQ